MPARLAAAAVAVVLAAITLGACGGASGPAPAALPAVAERGASVLTGTAERIDGSVTDLAAQRGRAVLVVNTASRCGNTPQYEGLEALHRSRSARGLVVLGFPSNDFGGQEPGSNREIAGFCRLNYGVTFPMFAKVAVLGDAAHPLFRRLAAGAGAPDWNFAKYLLDAEGRIVRRFPAATPPDDPALLDAVDAVLAEAGPV